VKTPDPQIPDVLVFERGCSADTRVLVMANFHQNSSMDVESVFSMGFLGVQWDS